MRSDCHCKILKQLHRQASEREVTTWGTDCRTRKHWTFPSWRNEGAARTRKHELQRIERRKCQEMRKKKKIVEILRLGKEEGTPVRVRVAERIKPREELEDEKEPRWRRMYFSPIKFSSAFRIANMHLNLIIQLWYIKCQMTVTEKHLKLIHMHEINPV